MRKKIIIMISVFVFLVLLIVNFSTVIIISNENVTARYVYGDKNITTELSDEDAKIVTKILNGKHVSVFDLPACGFDENVAVIINGRCFCIACDECGTVYYKERNGYISLNDNENEQIRNVLSKYGFEWLCY